MSNFGFPDVKPGHYIHKGGGHYTVTHLVRNSTNKDEGRPMVCYHSWTKGTPCVRDYEEFVEPIEWPDGVIRPRFCPAEAVPPQPGSPDTLPSP